ncbi:GIY-YIG nuclease family protein [Salinibacillus xinjiangensis]|uniref:GIY-YIG nuclease family protein n=1 Tax=Salinibacillus xinjiangensis TaxID=1229268 RepID=A0A6G1X7D3_9BACI|nr:GIY-YIG nuclease family protein [Salinibacillus xinjiangensis]MRG86874.1 GIY-YIG nuclease family protein [Salinibacillus xinjiangensis]
MYYVRSVPFVYYTYILRCKDGTLYTGYTNRLKHRLKLHREGKGAKYTRGRGPLKLEYVEGHLTKSDALKREYEIKQLSKKEKLGLVQQLCVLPFLNE